MFVEIKASDIKGKKYTAIFYNNDKKKLKMTHFGASGYSDYTQHKDAERKQRYINRHNNNNEDWTDPQKAGTLSRFILWNKKSLQDSIKDYANKFNLTLLKK